MPDQDQPFADSLNLVDGAGQGTYLTRCVALVTLLHERGILEELVGSGRITPEELDQRVALLEDRFPAFRHLGLNDDQRNQDISSEQKGV